ncbi:putative non-specific serine/threonine protein kinase [Helianthus anomalus]
MTLKKFNYANYKIFLVYNCRSQARIKEDGFVTKYVENDNFAKGTPLRSSIRAFENVGTALLGHAWRLYKQGKSIELISEALRASCVVPEVIRSIHVALLCVQHHAKYRPTMLSVLLMLVSDSALPLPKQPAFFTEENTCKVDSVSSFDEYMITLLYPR